MDENRTPFGGNTPGNNEENNQNFNPTPNSDINTSPNPNINTNPNPNINTNPNPNINTNPNPNQTPNNGWVFSEQERQNRENASRQDYSTENTANMNSGSNPGYESKYGYSSYHNPAPKDPRASNKIPDSAISSNPNDAQGYQWNYEDYQVHQSTQATAQVKKNKGLKVFAMIICGILCAGVVTLAGYGVYSIVSGPQGSDAVPEESVETGAEDPLQLSLTDKPEGESTSVKLSNGQLTITERANKVLPSVVGIVAYYQNQNIFAGNQGQGSGIITSADGYIITNAHVIDGASNLKVVLHDGTEYNAVVVGSDSKTDLAVIKIEATGITPAEFGNSDQLEIGEQVITIGNPGGLELAGSVTVGYVSALNRPVTTSQSTTINCIQTDAAINPGNSGGALVNEFGQVIGINSQKIAATEYEGIGFAISINEAQPIINDLIAHGYVTGRVRLGITAVEIDAYSAKMYGYQSGIGVTSVEATAPAAAAGLSAGDIITEVNGKAITSFKELNTILEEYKVGDSVSLTVFRKSLQSYQPDKSLKISVELIEAGKDASTTPKTQQQIPNQQQPQQPVIPIP